MSAAPKTKKIFDGRFEILGIVGRGARSVVYHARHALVPATEVAIKVLVDSTKGAAKPGENLHDKLRKEALAMVSARHRYVVRIDDFHTIDALCYLSMEYAPHGDLKKYLKTSGHTKLPLPQAETFLRQSTEALAFVHKSGIRHRDIKPENILVMHDEEIRLADFGVAVLPGEAFSIDELQAGVGTLAYMAPEVLEGREYTEQSDLYSLGVTFYELISGQHPFAHVPLFQQFELRKSGNIPDLKELEPNVSVALNQAIMGCLEFDPSMRIQSAAQIVRLLAGESFASVFKKDESVPPQELSAQTVTPTPPSSEESLLQQPFGQTTATDTNTEVTDTPVLAPAVEELVAEATPTPIQDPVNERIINPHATQVVMHAPFDEGSPRLVQDVTATVELPPNLSFEEAGKILEVIPNPHAHQELAQLQKLESEHDALAVDATHAPVLDPALQELSRKRTVHIPKSSVERATRAAQKDAPTKIPPIKKPVAAPESKKGLASDPVATMDGLQAPAHPVRRPSPMSFRPDVSPRVLALGLLGLVVAVVAVSSFIFRATPEAVVNTTTAESSLAKLAPQGASYATLAFPALTPGTYRGFASDIGPFTKVPMLLTVSKETRTIALVLGIDGWSVREKAFDKMRDGEQLILASNGIVFELKGEKELSGDRIRGTIINRVTNQIGHWEAQRIQ
jgi:serine/threonine protein kinase